MEPTHLVLVAISSSAIRTTLARELTQHGLIVKEAVDQVDALLFLKTSIPDAFVFSGTLDRGSGVTLAHALGTVEKTRHIPIMLIVNNSQVFDEVVNMSLRPNVVPIAANKSLEALTAAIVHGIESRLPKPDVHEETERSIENIAAEVRQDTAVNRLEAAYARCEAIVEMVNKNKLPGPVLPTMAHQVTELFRDPEVKIRTVAEFVEKHQAMSARLITIARSALYARGNERITSAAQALTKLGLEQAMSTMRMVAMLSYVVGEDPTLRNMIVDNLERSYATALVSELLAHAAKHPDPKQPFTVGLLSNIGSTFLLYTLALLQKKKPARLDYDAVRTMTVSREGRLNKLICRKMKLPEEIVQLRDTESAPEEKPKTNKTVRIVQQAVWVSEKLIDQKCEVLSSDEDALLVGLNETALKMLNTKLEGIRTALSVFLEGVRPSAVNKRL